MTFSSVTNVLEKPVFRAGIQPDKSVSGVTTKEALIASEVLCWQVQKDVEIPLALPSFMTGGDQATPMCLSMVAIFSLFCGDGLGQEVLERWKAVDLRCHHF